MSELLNLCICVVGGIAAVTAIDLIGSIASRKFSFNYGWLSSVSFLVYVMIGFFIGLKTNLISTIGGTFLVGIYDGTIGFQIAQRYGANWGDYKEEMESVPSNARIVMMFIVSVICGSIGFFISN